MATLFKNGKNYSGSSVKLDTTLSIAGQAADAKAVGDYLNVRYNEEKDCLMVLFDGEWVDSVYAGAQWDGYIYNNGNTYEDITGGFELSTNGSNAYVLTIQNAQNQLQFSRSGSYATACTGVANTVNMINTSKFTKMRVIGTVYSGSTNSAGFGCYLGLSTAKGKANTSVFSVSASGDNNAGVAFDKIVDITSCNDEYYFTIYYDSNWLGGVKITSIQFYK